MFVNMYGPTPGGGLFGSFFSGEPCGTSDVEGNARTFVNGPYAWSSLIVILPVASSVVMPEMPLALPLSNAAAPTMFEVKKDLPPHPIFIERSSENGKSDAFTGLPFEYTRFF